MGQSSVQSKQRWDEREMSVSFVGQRFLHDLLDPWLVHGVQVIPSSPLEKDELGVDGIEFVSL